MHKPYAPQEHLVTLADWSSEQIAGILEQASELKRNYTPYTRALAGRSAVLLFEKASLRTRVSFEIGVAKLGGHAVYLDHNSTKIGERETVEDYASNLSQWCDIIVARVNAHATIEALAYASAVPVVNALSDRFHPCQALADYLTLLEHRGTLNGATLAYVGDGNNVCYSLLIAGAKLGVSVVVVSPDGYGPDPHIVDMARRFAGTSGAQVTIDTDLGAIRGADAVYTDKWVSMGSNYNPASIGEAFAPYSITTDVLDLAGNQSIFMHCLPAERGREVAAEVIDGERSVVLQQAQNRMHAQCSLLMTLLRDRAAAYHIESRSGVIAAPRALAV